MKVTNRSRVGKARKGNAVRRAHARRPAGAVRSVHRAARASARRSVSHRQAKKTIRKAAARKPGKKTVPAETKKQGLIRMAAEAQVVKDAEAKVRAQSLVSDPSFLEFISKNVGTKANDIITTLMEGPRVDDKIAEALSLKLNETRRMLNMLNTYGVVRYNINKNNEGWLSFVWYLDYGAVEVLNTKVKSVFEDKGTLPEGCNDFFVCPVCSEKHKIVLPFEVAFENKFKCSCGKGLTMISRERAEQMYSQALA